MRQKTVHFIINTGLRIGIPPIQSCVYNELTVHKTIKGWISFSEELILYRRELRHFRHSKLSFTIGALRKGLNVDASTADCIFKKPYLLYRCKIFPED